MVTCRPTSDVAGAMMMLATAQPGTTSNFATDPTFANLPSALPSVSTIHSMPFSGLRCATLLSVTSTLSPGCSAGQFSRKVKSRPQLTANSASRSAFTLTKP